MEGDIVLAHELHQLHLIRVLPPGSPVRDIVGCDADVAYGRVKPHIEDLVLIPWAGYGRTPLQVTGDAPHFQAISHPGVGHLQCRSDAGNSGKTINCRRHRSNLVSWDLIFELH